MSGIYIKGMDMPKEGRYKVLVLYSDGEVSDRDGKVIGKAVPVPEHGRLILETIKSAVDYVVEAIKSLK